MMKRRSKSLVFCFLAAYLPGIAVQAITFEFDAADVFAMAGAPTDGLMQHQQEHPHRLWYRDLNGDIVNWGVTYSDSTADRYEAPDPAAAYANLQTWVSGDVPYQPRLTAFNLSLRPYDGTYAWGQDIVYRDPPADWTTGNATLATDFLSATAPPGWNVVHYWHPFAGPSIQWITDNYLDPSTTYIDPFSSGEIFSITGDFMRDTDLNGVGDTEFALGDDARLWVTSSTIWANWDAAGLDLSQASSFPQYDSIVGAAVTSVPCEPVTAVLMAISCGALLLFRRVVGE